MNDKSLLDLETKIRATARKFSYPDTPDFATEVARHLSKQPSRSPAIKLTWVIAILLVGLAIILLITPPVRAAVLDFIQFGAIRIFFTRPTITPSPADTHQPIFTQSPAFSMTTSPRSLGDLAGRTTLQDAQNQAGFNILLPTYPPDVGQPDQIYYQDLGGPAVLMLWMQPNDPERPYLSLLQLGPRAFAGKDAPAIIEEVNVNGNPALWLEGEHTLLLKTEYRENKNIQLFVDGNVLIWEEDEVTYRIESQFSQEKAIKIGESLQPIE